MISLRPSDEKFGYSFNENALVADLRQEWFPVRNDRTRARDDAEGRRDDFAHAAPNTLQTGSGLAGTNNVSRTPPEGHADDIASGIKAIIARLQAKAPKATIILMAIFPRTDIPTTNPMIDEINAKIARFANGREIRFLNINSQLADERGVFRAGVGVDRLQLALKGYQIWGEALKPILTELLGPPAATDEAPSATGDPAAARK